MSILAILIFLVLACVLVWGARAIMAAFGVGDPWATVVMVFLVVFLLIAFLGQVGYGPGAHLKLY